jgi:hypothetical protein
MGLVIKIVYMILNTSRNTISNANIGGCCVDDKNFFLMGD